ncbi:hypothetical protein ACFTWF_24645 [Rhodococcus sp. NPDC056960]
MTMPQILDAGASASSTSTTGLVGYATRATNRGDPIGGQDLPERPFT